MRVYLSGPMTGHEGFNYPAFHRAAERVRGAGFEVVNPAESFGGCVELPGGWPMYLRHDVALISGCQAVAVIPGWHESRGATVEVCIARALGMPILDAETLHPLDPQPRASFYIENGMEVRVSV